MNQFSSSNNVTTRRVGPPIGTMMFVITISTLAIVYSHYAQKRDKAIMRAGVERDKERLRITRQKQQQSTSE